MFAITYEVIMAADTNLAEFINDLIESEYKTNVKMAKTCDLDEGTIRRLRKGYKPSLPTLEKLSRGLRVPLDELEARLGYRQYESIKSRVRTAIDEIVSRLPQEDQEAVRQFAELLLERQNQTK